MTDTKPWRPQMTETEEAVARLRRHAVGAYGDLEDDLLFAIEALSASQAEVERLTRERDEAIREMGRYAAEAGEATGRLKMSEAAGIVDMWRDHAQAAEARATRAEGLLEALANAADVVGVAYFDSDDLSPEVEAMQSATLAARAFLDKMKEQGQ